MAAAIEKANAIRDAEIQWVSGDLTARKGSPPGNCRFNGYAPRHVDGSHLITPGTPHGVALRPHQKDGSRVSRSDEGPLPRTLRRSWQDV